jgi:hypothetical protein
VEGEAFGFIGLDEDALAAGVIDHVLVGDPVGDGDDDLVAFIEEDLGEVEDGVLAADGDDTFGGT